MSASERARLKDMILLSLGSAPKKLRELSSELKTRPTSVMHAIYELQSQKMISKMNKKYCLTNKGRVNALLLKALKDAKQTIDKAEDYWLNHDISGIPEHLLMRLGELKNCYLVKSTPADLERVIQEYVKRLSQAREVKGVSPIFHPTFLEAALTLTSRASNIKLILTKDVLGKVISAVNGKMLQQVLATGLVKLYIRENIKVALTVTESSFSLGLFSLDGNYDLLSDLMGEDAAALKWGNELFNYYLEGAQYVSL